jgi:flagellar motor switch protein FliM
MVGLLLDDCSYRLVQMNAQLGAVDRHGLLLRALPLIEAPRVEVLPDKEETDWKTQFPKAVQDAPAALTALLCEFFVPLATARALRLGTVLPLTG